MSKPIIPGCTVQLLQSRQHPQLVGEYFVALAPSTVKVLGVVERPAWKIAGHGWQATIRADWLQRVDWDERQSQLASTGAKRGASS